MSLPLFPFYPLGDFNEPAGFLLGTLFGVVFGLARGLPGGVAHGLAWGLAGGVLGGGAVFRPLAWLFLVASVALAAVSRSATPPPVAVAVTGPSRDGRCCG
ncbi:MAG TPA: hypothetical protein PLB02_13705, partial [Thermoanaerobaculia bacterium]|nr:hypothetical protein [Thermoanaerobaculia bacterium]